MQEMRATRSCPAAGQLFKDPTRIWFEAADERLPAALLPRLRAFARPVGLIRLLTHLTSASGIDSLFSVHTVTE
jgi:hypothetical protein